MRTCARCAPARGARVRRRVVGGGGGCSGWSSPRPRLVGRRAGAGDAVPPRRGCAAAQAHGVAQEPLDLGVDRAQVVGRPALELAPQVGVDAQQELLAGHRPSLRPASPPRPPASLVERPVLITGVTCDSPQSTTIRLLTMAARRSGSNSTRFFSLNSSSACSTMLDGAPHDLLAGGDHRFGLLAAQHGLGDLGSVGEVGEARLVDGHAGLGQALAGVPRAAPARRRRRCRAG